MAQDFLTRNLRLGQEMFCLCPASEERAEPMHYPHTLIRGHSTTSFSQAMSDSKSQLNMFRNFSGFLLTEKNLHLTLGDMEA